MFQTSDVIKTLNLLYYLFDEKTKNSRYNEVVNELVKRMIRVGIPQSKERYQLVLKFVHKMTIERAATIIIEVIKVYQFLLKYNQNFLFQDTDSNHVTNEMKIKEILTQFPQFLQLDIKDINESVVKYFSSAEEEKYRKEINETILRIVEVINKFNYKINQHHMNSLFQEMKSVPIVPDEKMYIEVLIESMSTDNNHKKLDINDIMKKLNHLYLSNKLDLYKPLII